LRQAVIEKDINCTIWGCVTSMGKHGDEKYVNRTTVASDVTLIVSGQHVKDVRYYLKFESLAPYSMNFGRPRLIFVSLHSDVFYIYGCNTIACVSYDQTIKNYVCHIVYGSLHKKDAVVFHLCHTITLC
jgi:hypothetical protein